MAEKTNIVLDTNFLMIPGFFGVDIFDEIDRICDFQYEFKIIDKTFDELKDIQKNQKGRNVSAAKLAEKLIIEKKIEVIESDDGHYVDDVLVNIGSEYVVATNDAKLIERLRKQKKIVAWDNQ